MKNLILLFIIVTLTQNVFAVTFNSFSNGNWTDASTWSQGFYPGAVSSNNVTLPDNNNINIDHTLLSNYSLILNGNSNLKLNVNSGAALIVAGDVIIPKNKNPKINVVGTATKMANLTIKGNLVANAQLEITVENGVLRIEGDMLGANNANVKLNVLENGILYIKENIYLNNNVNFSFDGAGTVLIDGNMDMRGFNSNPLDGIIAVLGTVSSKTNIQKQDNITLWGDNFNANSVGHDARTDVGIAGPAHGTYNDFATNYPNLCAYSDYCNSTFAPPLPVTFVKVDALIINQETKITWSTAQQENNNYFEVERSLDGNNWDYVGAVEGAGNSIELLEYELMDYAPESDLVYYRVKQVDYDGLFAYSDVVYVTSEKLEENLKAGVYPNPNNGSFYFELEKKAENILDIRLLDMQGEVKEVSYIQNDGLVKVNVETTVNAGYYFITIRTTKNSYHSSFIIK